jgi:putative ergosteryl-3beta-O-L-aspartate hydrolase
MKAIIWRELMKIGVAFHKQAPPRPAPPSFTIEIPSRISSKLGSFKLVFYVPDEYKSARSEQRFPVVVNFHGGGFTLGTGMDDARWAQLVVENTKAVLVSVEYRLAPKYPFSVGVEDGTDAVVYLAAHADELRLDPHRIALSGFSAGGNFAFTVPLMVHDLQIGSGKRTIRGEHGQAAPSSLTNQSSASLPVESLSIESIFIFRYPPAPTQIPLANRSRNIRTNPTSNSHRHYLLLSRSRHPHPSIRQKIHQSPTRTQSARYLY